MTDKPDLELREKIAALPWMGVKAWRAVRVFEVYEGDSGFVFKAARDGNCLAVETYAECPAYECDWAAVMDMQSKIPVELREGYGYELTQIVCDDAKDRPNSLALDNWLLAHASPEQRCRAILAAMGDET